MKINKIFITISIISGIVLFYSRCINSSMPATSDVRGEEYAGSMSCMKCHQEIHNNYSHNPHSLTSGPVSSIKEDIFSAADSFTFTNNTTVKIEKRDSGIYQVSAATAKRFDLKFGSGTNAYSFGYWQDERLYQLPLSYFTSIHGWANSPGFPAGYAYFQRPIIRRCFECHSSYIGESLKNMESVTQARKLDQNTIVYGIDCERCHGPAANHVAFQTANPSIKEARYITKWAALSRQQKLDVCGVCHSGNDLTTQKSTFSFVPGDTLSKFYYPEFMSASANVPDVHGNQSQLLAGSMCFQKGNGLECSSCHNTHASKPPDVEGYSKMCTSCHNHPDHKDLTVVKHLNNTVINNCIDCHMPRQASKLISFQVTGKKKADMYLLRTHRIAVYPDETSKVIAGKSGK